MTKTEDKMKEMLNEHHDKCLNSVNDRIVVIFATGFIVGILAYAISPIGFIIGVTVGVLISRSIVSVKLDNAADNMTKYIAKYTIDVTRLLGR